MLKKRVVSVLLTSIMLFSIFVIPLQAMAFENSALKAIAQEEKTEITAQVPLEESTKQTPEEDTGEIPGPDAEESPTPDTGETPEPDAEESPTPDTRETPEPDAEESPAPDTEETPKPDAEESPAPDTEETPEPDAEESPAPDTEETPEPDAEESPTPDTGETPEPDAEENPKEPSETTPEKVPEEEEIVLPPEAEIQALEEEVTVLRSGTCGDNIEWIVTSDNTLTLVGSGPMYDYDFCCQPYYYYLSRVITSIVIDDEITHIGDSAFCRDPRGESKVENVKFPEKLTSIGSHAFYYCKKLTIDSLPNGLKEIGTNAFTNVPFSLTALPDGLERIGNQAFWNSKFLNGLSSLPSGLRTIGKEAFYMCDLTEPMVLEIPASVEEIGDYAFAYCQSLVEVTIPDTSISFGKGVFSHCTALERANWPECMAEIPDSLYSCCENLTSFSLPDTVTRIGGGAFSYCKNLAFTSIPDSVTYVGANAFHDCIKFEAALPPELVYIGEWAFCGTGIEEITLPDSLTYIGAQAFCRTGITNVDWPESVTAIEDGTFFSCEFLEEIHLPETLESIGKDAFGECDSLTELVLPNNVSYLGPWFAGNTHNLKHIKVDPASRVLVESEDIMVPQEAFKALLGIRSVSVPQNVKKIDDMVFWGAARPAPYAVFIERADRMVIYKGCMVPGENVNFYVPPNLYEEYMNDEDWTYGIEFGDYQIYTNETAELNLSADHGTAESAGFYELPDNYPGETITLTATPDEGYIFVEWQSDEVEFADSTAAETTFVMPVGGATVKAVFAREARTIVEVTDPEGITVDSDTPAEELPLPETVEATLDDGTTVWLPVSWDTSAYNSALPGVDQTLTGSLVLQEGIENPSGFEATISVTVKPLDIYDIITLETLTDIVVPLETPVSDLNLPAKVTVFYDKEEAAIETQVPVTWDTTGYQMDQVGTYPLTGTLLLPAELRNPRRLEPQIKVIVVAAQRWEVGAENPGDVIALLYEDPNEAGKKVLELKGSGAIQDFATAGKTPWYSERATVSKVVVGEGITAIGKFAFNSLANMTEVVLPEGLEVIGINSFNSCSGLTEVAIPASVTSIADGAFYGCKTLTSISFEDRVGTLQAIGSRAFQPSKANLRTTITIYYNNPIIYNYPWSSEGRIVEILLKGENV